MSKLHRDNAGYVGCSYEDTQDPYYSYNKLSLPLSGATETVQRPAEVTHTVTVAGGKFVIGGVSQATLSLVEGGTYKFDQSDSSNSTHPFKFSQTSDGTHNRGTEYTKGVTYVGTPGSSGAYTQLVVPFGGLDLYYYCGNHSGMGGSASTPANAGMFTAALPILKTTDAFGNTLGSGNNADPYAANLVLAIPMNGSNNGTTFTDVSNVIRGTGTAKTITVNNNAKTSTAESFYYGSSGYFDGSGDRLVLGNASDLVFDGDFTMETWLYINDANSVSYPNGDRQIAGVWTGSNNDWLITYSGTSSHNTFLFQLYIDGSVTVFSSGVDMSAYVNKWVHLAVVRNSGAIQLYVDGVPKGNRVINGTSFGKTSNVAIGGRVGGDANTVAGYLADFRIYKGVAKYQPEGSGSLGMDCIAYVGTGSTRSVDGLAFKPDLVWIKGLATGSNTIQHVLQDTVRGTGAILSSQMANREADFGTHWGYISSFNDNGFTLTPGAGGPDHNNHSGTPYIAWCWKAGGAAVSNTDGTITSQVSASTAYGFSVVTWTAASNSNNDVGHSLGSTPKFAIFKSRTAGDRGWTVYHESLGGTNKYLRLNTTGAVVTDTNYWGTSSEWTNQTFGTYATSGAQDNNFGDMVGYVWSEVAGFSKFGSYSGASNLKITTGFKPRFVLIKCSSEGGFNWVIVDSARGNQSNGVSNKLYPNLGADENNDSRGTETKINFLDDGFQFADQGAETNSGGRTYIYAAFAESAPGDPGQDAFKILETLNTKDQSSSAHTVTNNGASFQTSVKKFYDGAADFSGNGKVTVSGNDFAFGTGDYTIEMWVYHTALGAQATYFGDTYGSTAGVYFYKNSANYIGVYYSSQIATGGTLIPQNSWVHVAAVRNAGTTTVYVNGSPDGSSADSTNLTVTDYGVGETPGGNSGSMEGYIQDVRVYKGIAKYTSSFSPPERSVQGTARRYPSGVYVVS